MKGHGTDTSSRMNEMQSSPGIFLPSITSLMRNEFIPLMQCLEQGDDILYKTYNVELSLTLARFDALLKEEERRMFVCAFDALVRHLLKDLHHFMDVEALLQQDVPLLLELAERCRMVEYLCSCYVRSGEASGGGLKGSKSILGNSSPALRGSAAVAAATSGGGGGGAMADAKGQQETPELVDTLRVSCSFNELQQQFPGGMTRQLQPAPLSATCATPGASGNFDDQVPNHNLRSTSTPQRISQQTPPVGAAPFRGMVTRQAVWWCEEFQEFLAGHLLKDDIADLVNMLLPKGNNVCEGKPNANNTYEESALQATAKVASHMGSKNGGGNGSSSNNTNNNNSSSGALRPGAHVSSVESTVPRRLVQSVEENDSFARASEASFVLDSSVFPTFPAPPAGGRAANQMARYLNMLAEGLLHGGTSVPTSLNSSFCSMEDTDQNSSTVDMTGVENRRSATAHSSDFTRRITALPSHAALVLLKTLFPSLRNYAEDFARLSEGCILVPTEEVVGAGSVCAAPVLLTTDASSPVRPVDVVMFSLLCSLQKTQNAQSVPAATTSTACVGESEELIRKAAASEDATATVQPQENAATPSLPRQMAVELESMARQVQESIASAQAMQEQIQEEITLLLFRVMSTTVDILLPAVSCVDQRAVMFYRKWICDMYRLLWEENLLGRFSRLSTLFMQHESNNKLPTCGTSPLFTGTQPSTPRHSGGRRHAEKGGSVHAASKSACTPISARENTRVLAEEGVDERRDDAMVWIAPGNVYSRSMRSLADAECGGDELISRSSTAIDERSGLYATTAAATSTSSATTTTNTNTTVIAAKDLGHSHDYDLFDDPAVLIAESLLEDTSTEVPPPRGFLVTRLMAALLRGLDSNRRHHFATASESTAGSECTTAIASTEPQSGFLRRTASAKRALRLLLWRKDPSSPLQSPSSSKKKANTSSPEAKGGAHLQQYPRFRYPLVTSASDVKSLYFSALFDAEMVLSPLDPIRAALVQNTVDYLVSGMCELREAYEVLDAYLDDVGTEQIQTPSMRRALLDGSEENANSGNSNSLTAADSPFSVTTVRRAKQMLTGSLIGGGGGKAHAPHAGHGAQAKRGAGAAEKDDGSAALKLPVVPKVIPSWNSLDESEQFLLILALLRRVYITLREAVDAASSPIKPPPKDALK